MEIRRLKKSDFELKLQRVELSLIAAPRRVYLRRTANGTSEDSEMPAREAYLVKKNHRLPVPSGQTLFPAVLETVCSKLTFWRESPAGSKVRGPDPEQGSQEWRRRRQTAYLVPSLSGLQKQSAQSPGGPEGETSWDLYSEFLDQDTGTWFLSSVSHSCVSGLGELYKSPTSSHHAKCHGAVQVSWPVCPPASPL